MLRPCLIALLLSCMLAPAAFAQDGQEFRRLNLNDGRELLGIVLESSATGMRIRVPQGTVEVGYDKLSDMATIDMGAWMAQPAARVAVAPSAALDEEVRALAGDVDGWLSRAAAVVPRTAVVGPDAWREALGPRAAELTECRGGVDCLRDLLQTMQIDYLIVPTLKPGPPNRLSLMGVVASSGALLGTAQVTLVQAPSDPDRVDLQRSGGPAARAVFDALDFKSDADVKAAVATIFPPPEPVASTPVDPGPVAKPAPTASADPPRGAVPNRGVSVALGFAPVPGLSSAYLRDGPGFLVSLLGTVGASWGSIYGVGTTARSAEAFWAPNILIPYAISVAFNQLSAAIGWQRLYGGKSARASLRLSPLVLPRSDGGVTVTVAAQF